MTLEIRKATIQDIALICELALQVWPQTYTPIIGERQVAYMLDTMYNSAALEQQMQQGQQFVLCYDSANAIAFASYSLADSAAYKLNKIYILPGMQGKGAGRFVIEHITAQICELGATSLLLNVNRYNPAKTFYEKLGFRVVKDEDIDIGGGFFMNDHVMELGMKR